jgi:hypothetical protein
MYLARSMTFRQDEWGWITFDGAPLDFIRPWNEHWSTIPLLMYRATFAAVGLHSYLPYIAQVIALHVVAVGAAYVLIRARGGPTIAALACIPLFFLGSGSENLFWAFQTGFVGSVAFGLWALVLLDRSGRGATVGASILLLASLMSSGMGLFMVVAAFGRTVLDRAARRRTVAVIPPIIAYGLWFLVVGREPVTQAGHLASPVAVGDFVVRGIGHAVGAVSGIRAAPGGSVLSFIAFGLASLATGWAVAKARRPPALAAGALLAVAAMYLVIGLARAGLETDFSTRSRYVYVAGFFLVLAAIDWLPQLLAWTSGRKRARVALTGVLLVALVAVTAANVAAFRRLHAQFGRQADLTRAFVELALSTRGDGGWADPDSVLLGMPPLPVLIDTVERFGSPGRDDLVPSVVRDPGRDARESALLLMIGSGFRVEPGTGVAAPLPIDVAKVDDAAAAPDDGCLTVTEAGPDARVTVTAPSGARLRVTPSDDGKARALLGLARPPSSARDLALQSGTPLDVVVPDIGDGSTWTVRFDLPDAAGTIGVCRIR